MGPDRGFGSHCLRPAPFRTLRLGAARQFGLRRPDPAEPTQCGSAPLPAAQELANGACRCTGTVVAEGALMSYSILKAILFAVGLLGSGVCIAEAKAWGGGQGWGQPKPTSQRPSSGAVSAPELSGHAGAAGATVLLGAAAMLASRRRNERTA